MNLAMEDPPEEDRLSILNDVWKVVMKLKDTNVSLFENFLNKLKFVFIQVHLCFIFGVWSI